MYCIYKNYSLYLLNKSNENNFSEEIYAKNSIKK